MSLLSMAGRKPTVLHNARKPQHMAWFSGPPFGTGVINIYFVKNYSRFSLPPAFHCHGMIIAYRYCEE